MEMAALIELVFFAQISLDLSYTVFSDGISKNKDTSLWNFIRNSGLGTFGHGTSSFAKRDINNQHSSTCY